MAKQRQFKSAELVSDAEGRQYHIGCAPGDVAPYILLTGEPRRAHRVAGYFDSAKKPITSREYVTITGKYKGMPITVMATGMGPDNTEIAVVELSQIVKHPTFIRIGSSGAMRKGIELADLVVSTGAVRLENTSTQFVVEGYPAVAHHEVVIALLEAAKIKRFPYHAGLTATGSGFYGAQGRTVPGFPPRDSDVPAKLDKMNVANMEMEASCLFTLATLSGARAGAVCAIYANRHKNKFIDSKTKDLAEKRCIETGLAAFEVLKKLDKAKGQSAYWTPSMGI